MLCLISVTLFSSVILRAFRRRRTLPANKQTNKQHNGISEIDSLGDDQFASPIGGLRSRLTRREQHAPRRLVGTICRFVRHEKRRRQRHLTITLTEEHDKIEIRQAPATMQFRSADIHRLLVKSRFFADSPANVVRWKACSPPLAVRSQCRASRLLKYIPLRDQVAER